MPRLDEAWAADDTTTILHLVKCPGCSRRIIRPLVFCPPCWSQVPAERREIVARAWAPGPPNDAFVEAIMDAAKTVQLID